MSNCCQQQQYVQPVVQPVVAAQPRPSIAYSYGYPSTGEIKLDVDLAALVHVLSFIRDHFHFLTSISSFVFIFCLL